MTARNDGTGPADATVDTPARDSATARGVLPDCMMPDGAGPCLAYRQEREFRDELVAALRPFAELIGGWTGNGYDESPDDEVVRSVGTIGRDYAFITVRDLRRARAVLAKIEGRQP